MGLLGLEIKCCGQAFGAGGLDSFREIDKIPLINLNKGECQKTNKILNHQ